MDDDIRTATIAGANESGSVRLFAEGQTYPESLQFQETDQP